MRTFMTSYRCRFWPRTAQALMLPCALVFGLSLCGHGWATEDSGNVIASVNGQAISKILYEQALKANLGPNQAANPEVEKLVKEELISRVLLVQDAKRLGLDKTPEAEAQWAQIQENFLIELLTKHLLVEKPISDAELHQEYDRQVEILGKNDAGTQYNIKLIMVPTEPEARDLLAEIKRGAMFEKLAHEKSVDPSKSQGGSVGWVLPSQIFSGLANVMVNLKKGAVAVAPIQTPSGWALLKVEDTRPFKIPPFGESRNELVAALIQARRAEYLKKIRATADVKL